MPTIRQSSVKGSIRQAGGSGFRKSFPPSLTSFLNVASLLSGSLATTSFPGAASASVSTRISVPSVMLWPRLCKNVFERDRYSKSDWKSRFYAKSTSADVPINFRFNVDAHTSIFVKRFYTLWADCCLSPRAATDPKRTSTTGKTERPSPVDLMWIHGSKEASTQNGRPLSPYVMVREGSG